ncbi:MAG: hypothetical protein H7Y41_04435, partial [Hyphomonadaceae bacterium]|nr:hypothetical protein [Clostridia bacterium]
IITNACVTGIESENNTITAIQYQKDGEKHTFTGDVYFSTMPIKDLVGGFKTSQVPTEVAKIAKALPYRDFITVGLLVNKLNLKNQTKIKTIGNIVPDCWIYIQEAEVTVGRLQIFNNWSPYLVKDIQNTVWVGLEYFVNEGDTLWQKSEQEMIRFATEECIKMGMIEKADVLDANSVQVKKAYPAYFGSYEQFDEVKAFLDQFDNLFCIGRNGQHRYNNMDHSMLSAMEAVKNVIGGVTSKQNVWSVNTDEQYHETKEK